MKAQVSHEVVGTTSFGDPEIVVTVLEPHPKAGFQLLLRSTASMDHMTTPQGQVDWLVDEFPLREGGAFSSRWHGTSRASSAEGAVELAREHVDWLWRREQFRENVFTTDLKERLERFDRGLWETNAIDYEEEWAHLLTEVARVTLSLKGVPDDDA